MAAYCATPILYLNMGGEMMYVLQQRLQTQRVNSDKTAQVLSDVTHALLNPKQLGMVFERGPLMGLGWQRASLERVVLSSIMKLDDNSMNKLFDLMIMMVKYQLTTATGPREVVLSTLNHLDALRDMLVDRKLRELVDHAHRLVVETYGCMTYQEIWQIRDDCLREIQEHCVRVSVLLRLGMQNEDTSFNRLVQRYDEKYQERREVLANFKLLDYSEDERVMGALSIVGNRVTLLGRNVYSPAAFGLGGRSCLHLVAVSNRSARREIEALATQLGREEPSPAARPFSLRLFGHDDRAMDCTPDDSRLDNGNQPQRDEEGNLRGENESLNDYRSNLIRSIGSDFEDDAEPAKTQDMDIMNMLDVM